MDTTVKITSPSNCASESKNGFPRVAWLLQGADSYWQPILSEFSRLLLDTKVFASKWSGFMPGFEDAFAVQQVGARKIIKLPGRSRGYNNCITYLPPGAVKPLIEYQPQVVFTTGFSLWTILVCFLKLIFRWKVVIVYDGSSPGVDHRNSWVRSQQRRLLSTLTDAFITNNQAGKQYLVESLKVPRERVFARPYLLPHPKAFEASLGIAKPTMEKRQKPVFLFVGNLIPRKGLSELLKACSVLREKGFEKFTIVVVGDGSERSSLEVYVQEQGLSAQVLWVGAVEYGKVGSYFDSADVFIFPTREDVWGLVLVEAMLFGKPVLASKWAGASELVIEGENGFVFDPCRPEQLAELMEKFINSPKLIDQMGQKSRLIMDNHQPEKVAQSLAQVVDFVIGDR